VIISETEIVRSLSGGFLNWLADANYIPSDALTDQPPDTAPAATPDLKVDSRPFHFRRKIMNKFTATFASIAATLLLAGNAMAQMPAAGEGPFVEHQDYAAKRVQKTEVTRAPVSIKQVAVGEMNGIAKQTNDVNSPSRAEVRQETRDAISAGHGPATGAL